MYNAGMNVRMDLPFVRLAPVNAQTHPMGTLVNAIKDTQITVAKERIALILMNAPTRLFVILMHVVIILVVVTIAHAIRVLQEMENCVHKIARYALILFLKLLLTLGVRAHIAPLLLRLKS